MQMISRAPHGGAGSGGPTAPAAAPGSFPATSSSCGSSSDAGPADTQAGRSASAGDTIAVTPACRTARAISTSLRPRDSGRATPPTLWTAIEAMAYSVQRRASTTSATTSEGPMPDR